MNASASQGAPELPDYAPVPASAFGPALNEQGYYVGRVERNLYWVTDGVGTRDDVTLHQQYMTDVSASARQALMTTDPTPYFAKYGANVWAGVKGYLDAVTDAAAAPVIEKYTGVLAAADVFTPSVAFWVLGSNRLNLGFGSQVHP